ncbi:uncharacterized protein EMH_0035450 [Eimeria mitis]|uniref:Uncharacterized protein n=1 Tax=Eimeria mitis TaxID=44415 RepID=U6JSV5_9EIME|nr:uncharacterized protein EMH_0035450 [Eimeria mitis]CDJ27851.1 hypothetical protein EMH_0035450 [Eimeria mitis]
MDKTEADCAYEELANQISKMTAEEAAVFLRSPIKRYKAKHRKAGRIKIKELINQARKNTEEMKGTIQGLNCIVMLPEAEADVDRHKPIVGQGRMICAILERSATPADRKRKENCLWDQGTHEDKEESPWPNAILEFTEFDKWMEGVEARSLPEQVLQLLRQYRLLFPDSLPNGLPPKRPFDHRILLIPGKLPTKAPIYKMPPDHLIHHSQEIERLCAKGWIGPTYSPICAPTIMGEKRDDGSGERKMRMVINYQALNALTIATEFPMPCVQTVMEMIGGATYFSTLDLEAGFHQIRMAREDRWKTAFRSIQGLFEYKVMTPAQQKYSIYDQELLALISALDKWRHLLRVAKVTAYTDHQALTFLQRLNSQKPLRGRTARWLDFLAEFSDLTITYLQGAKNKVADAMSRHPQHTNGEPNRLDNILAPIVQQQEEPAAQPRYSTRLVTGSAPHPDFRAMIGRRLALRNQRRGGVESQQPAGSADGYCGGSNA